MLIMEHELFRHMEIEVFVRRSQVAAALDFVKRILPIFDGRPADTLPQAIKKSLDAARSLADLTKACGSYTHHYPICVRRVLPDDTLISMSSGGDEPSYALSFISYARPQEREGFFGFAQFLAHSMGALYGARRHWGKVCPHSREEIEKLYPRAGAFREICRRYDPTGVFRNAWIEEVLFCGGDTAVATSPSEPLGELAGKE
jgi:hypothetical protein